LIALNKIALWTLLLLIVIAALAGYAYRIRDELKLVRQQNGRNEIKISLLHVQLMRQVISQQQVQDVDELLTTPEEWLATPSFLAVHVTFGSSHPRCVTPAESDLEASTTIYPHCCSSGLSLARRT
jgi:hypothetical protein